MKNKKKRLDCGDNLKERDNFVLHSIGQDSVTSRFSYLQKMEKIKKLQPPQLMINDFMKTILKVNLGREIAF